jgi:site-specific DNA-cytosine methylase
MGYRLAAGLFTAAEVGAPHRRERLFILAHRDAGDPAADPVGSWPTPVAGDSKGTRNRTSGRTRAEGRHHDGVTLCDATRMWMTPTARDHKDGATSLANTPVNGLLGRQVLTMPTAGSDTSDARRTLNPHSSRR